MSVLTLVDKARLLLSSDIFRALSLEEATELAKEVTQREIKAGEVLFERGDIGEHLYIVVSGRFRVYLDDPVERESKVDDVLSGEVIGELALITGDRRAATVHAVRDSSILVVTKSSFERIAKKSPHLMFEVARVQIERLHRVEQTKKSLRQPTEAIALLPAGGNLNVVEAFATRLAEALSSFSPVLRLRSGQDSTSAISTKSEEPYRFILYEADPSPSVWNTRSVRQADSIILVADDSSDSGLNAVEFDFDAQRGTAASPHRHLVLLQTGAFRRSAASWLQSRHVDMHHHVAGGNKEDYARVARFLAGKATGLVLGGGGARGFAHIGVVQALAEAGIPIDAVGGTSMGALIAAMVAFGLTPDDMREACRKIFVERGIWDFTIPILSLVAAKRISISLEEIFHDQQIEDLPRNYFCVTTNLSRAEVCVHRHGPVTNWVKASVSIPGVAPPIIYDGDLLYDGGILNNLPVDIMRRLGPRSIIAANVSSFVDASLVNIPPEACSPWHILLSRLNPFAPHRRHPNIFHILYRSSMLNSLRSAVAAQTSVSLFIDPHVAQFGLFEWKAIDQIVEAGLLHARTQVAQWLLVAH
jgi:predicted acylesterase/phospholipase RssA/CRP-like cAMP-binding protein